MSNSDTPVSDFSPHHVDNITVQNRQPQSSKNEKKKITQRLLWEHRLLIYGVLFLSTLGVFAFLVTGQVAVVVAMNTPLLAIIGKDYFLR